jgi:hypothetical protein
MWVRPSAVDQRSCNAAHRLSPAQGCDRLHAAQKVAVAAGPSVTASEPSTTGERGIAPVRYAGGLARPCLENPNMVTPGLRLARA